jgi:CheY-like chemotaxis protein
MLVRHCVCRFLEQRGFTVITASNGVEALDRLSEHEIDLVITDMQMPRMDGRELIAELKKRPGTAIIPVIIVTGCRTTKAHQDCGANYSIYKDIEIEGQLGAALVKIFGKSAATAAGK